MQNRTRSFDNSISATVTAPTGAANGERWPAISRRHAAAIGGTALVYLLVVIGILCDTWLVDLDWMIELFHPYHHWPDLQPYLDVWVIAGQRGPTAIAACLWLARRAHRLRTLRPLLVMGAALLMLNVTVGGVKIVTGRLGPHYAHYVGSPELFSGGNIFPSGHTANAVVTWGVLAYLASRWRRTGTVIAAATALSVGLTTVYLGTHWVSDVVAGWAAGALVLLALPLMEPAVAAAEAWIVAEWRRRRTAQTAPGMDTATRPPAPAPVPGVTTARPLLPAQSRAPRHHQPLGRHTRSATRPPARSRRTADTRG